MKIKKKYLQCGYEDLCKNKDCLKCPRRTRMSLSLTHAQRCAIEDCVMVDLDAYNLKNQKNLN